MEALTKQMEMFHTIFFVCFVLFLIFVAIDIFLFFYLKIGMVIGYLTGKTAKKTIEQMIEEGQESGGLLTGSRKQQEKKKKKNIPKKKGRQQNTIMTPSGEMKLPGSDEVMLSVGGDITDMLEGIEPTNPVSQAYQEESPKGTTAYGRFEIIKNIILIHTEEQI